MSTTNWRNMMIWYNINPYYIPNIRWKIPMLSSMNGGSWQKHNSEKKCKTWLHIGRMRMGIKDICMPSRKPF
jgi:hypothetical protein